LYSYCGNNPVLCLLRTWGLGDNSTHIGVSGVQIGNYNNVIIRDLLNSSSSRNNKLRIPAILSGFKIGLVTSEDEIKVTSYNKQFDVFDRITEANLAEDGQDILTYEYGYKKHQNNENRLTTQINKEIIKTKLETITREYTYDGTGNVGVVSENGIAKRFYYYDYSGQLEKEYICENDIYNTIYGIEYAYDQNGNIKSKKVFDDANTLIKDIGYKYEYDAGENEDNNWPDRLVKYGPDGQEKTIKYNDSFAGNPTFYGIIQGEDEQGIRFEWEGRRLTGYHDDATGLDIKYSYNDRGLRIKKKIVSLNEEHTYYYEGSRLISEDGVKHFLYDEAGILYGMIFIKYAYYYIRDILGNIIGLVDKDGRIVVKYAYDAFGNILQISGMSL
jgi:YD repeat-containing protein